MNEEVILGDYTHQLRIWLDEFTLTKMKYHKEEPEICPRVMSYAEWNHEFEMFINEKLFVAIAPAEERNKQQNPPNP